ncbi:MAG TPA: hypothetical protein VNJ08_09245 [Bacteriovoracaceae bacterium]|nr:hypothetical protein [Bacteriovoracaceae bacterium]
MGEFKSSGKMEREEREKMIILKHKYVNRITTVRFGKECLDGRDYSGAIRRFTEYMDVICEVKGAKDLFHLKISHFNPNKDITEMLMISGLYFEMAKIYDAIPQPKFVEDTQKCIEQFVHFTVNQPYQILNSELIRKSLKKNQFRNQEVFRAAHQQIFVSSKKCYIVTFCYGDNHPVTQEYRLLKDLLLKYRWGQEVVRYYYKYSSTMVPAWENNRPMQLIGSYILRPLLLLFSKTLLPLILRKC